MRGRVVVARIDALPYPLIVRPITIATLGPNAGIREVWVLNQAEGRC